MTSEAETKQAWKKFLQAIIADYRQQGIIDRRTDRDLLIAFMDYLVSTGHIQKVGNKYELPQLTDLDEIMKLLTNRWGINN